MQTVHSRGSLTKGTKSELATSSLPSPGPTSGRKWYVTRAFSGVPNKGDKIRMGYLTLPSRGPTSGRNCYVTRAFSGVPNKGDKIRIGYLNPAFLGAHKWVELLHNPCILGVPSKGDKMKSGYIGGKDKTVHMQPKRISPKKFLANGLLASKNTLKTPPQTILKREGGRKPLVVSDI